MTKIIVSRYIKDPTHYTKSSGINGYPTSETDWENFSDIIKEFGKENCFQIGKRLFVISESEVWVYMEK